MFSSKKKDTNEQGLNIHIKTIHSTQITYGRHHINNPINKTVGVVPLSSEFIEEKQKSFDFFCSFLINLKGRIYKNPQK